MHKSYISKLLKSLFFFPLLDMSPVDMPSVSSQLDEVCARILVRIGDQAEVNTEHL